MKNIGHIIFTRLATGGVAPVTNGITKMVVSDEDGLLSFVDIPGGGSGITSLNTLTGATQTFDVGTSGTNFNISSVGTVHTFNIPTASASNRGLLSTADWSTFNTKENVLTFNNGLTRSSNTVTNNLITGIAGGQTINGGTASGENLTINSTSHATKGKILLGSSSAYDGANIRFGINTAAPSAKLHIVQTGMGINPAIADGLYLQTGDVATSGNQKASPGLVWEAQGWKTNSVAASQAVAWMANILPVQGTVNPSSTWQLASSVNGGAFASPILTITDAGIGTFSGSFRATSSLAAGTQIVAGTTTTSRVYRTTNGGSDITPQLFVGNTTNTAGTNAFSVDLTNQLLFHAANGTRQIARAGVGLVGATNTAGSEEGELGFFTKPSGSGVTERIRITKVGNLKFSASGAAIDFNGDVTVTHGTDLLTIAGGDLAVTNLSTGGSAPSTTGTPKMAVVDGTGKFSFQDIPATPPTLASGYYTPSVYGVANVTMAVPHECMYLRVGNAVQVSGYVEIQPILISGSTILELSLPIATTITDVGKVAGAAYCPAVESSGAAVVGNTASDKANIQFISTNTALSLYYFTFMYDINVS